MWKGLYVLEVVKFITERENLSNEYGKYEHIGYMKLKFNTKDECVTYYNTHNLHMRSLNAHGTYASDWDARTKLLYIVREDHMLNATIDPFSTN